MYLLKESTNINLIQPWLNKRKSNSQPSFCWYFIVDLLIQHKFHCVNLIGRTWRTWKLNRITPKYLLCATMYLVALGFWRGFGKPCDSVYYNFHLKSMDFLDLLPSVFRQRYSKTHSGHRGPSITGSTRASSCAVSTIAEHKLFNQIDDGTQYDVYIEFLEQWHAVKLAEMFSFLAWFPYTC